MKIIERDLDTVRIKIWGHRYEGHEHSNHATWTGTMSVSRVPSIGERLRINGRVLKVLDVIQNEDRYAFAADVHVSLYDDSRFSETSSEE